MSLKVLFSLLQKQISLYDLLSSIEGRARDVPEDAAFAIGIVLRCLLAEFAINSFFQVSKNPI
jgi:hypothetical protein